MDFWTPTKEERKEDFIKRMAKAGATFSKHCRNSWTGDKTRTTLNLENFGGCRNDLLSILNLRGEPLFDFSTTADLNTLYLGCQDQHNWDQAQWEKEIRARIK